MPSSLPHAPVAEAGPKVLPVRPIVPSARTSQTLLTRGRLCGTRLNFEIPIGEDLFSVSSHEHGATIQLREGALGVTAFAGATLAEIDALISVLMMTRDHVKAMTS